MKKYCFLVLLIAVILISGCSINVSINVTRDNDISSNEGNNPIHKNYLKGRIEDDYYINDFLNFKIVPSENIYMYLEDEMLGYYERENEFYEEISNFYHKYKKEVIDLDYELLLHNNITGSSLSIASFNKFVSNMNIDSYVDILFEQICSVDDYNIVDSSVPEDFDLFGTNFKLIFATISNSYVIYDKAFLYAFFDNRIVQISIDCLTENDFYDYMDCFKYITNQV